jgi:plasmid stabilization system protein ParE
MAFRVEQTARADRDLDDILTWLLAEGAGETGLRWVAGMKKAIGSLSELPARCPLANENATFPFEVRQLLYGHKGSMYRVLFTIREDVVSVLHIRRPGQDVVSFH